MRRDKIPNPRPIVWLVLIAWVGGCVSLTVTDDEAGSQTPARRNASAKSPGQITPEELDGMTKAYADRYMTLIASACDALSHDNPDFQQRRMATRFKVESVNSIYDIVTNPDPFTQLVDLMLVVTLQSQVWIDEARADEVFGDRADLLIRPLRQAREDIWAIGSRVMKSQQLQVLDELIWDWREEYQQVQFVSFIRFNDFSSSRGKSIVSDVQQKGTGFLAPVDEAKRAVDEARLLGERIFFISKRAPFLLAWHTEATVNELLANDKIDRTLSSADRLSESADRVSKVVEKLPEQLAGERLAIQKGVNEQTDTMKQMLGEYRQAVAETDKLVGSLNKVGDTSKLVLAEMRQTSGALEQTIAAMDQLVARFEPAPDDPQSNAKPFDINEYTRAAAQFSQTAKQWTEVIDSAGRLMESAAWSKRLREIDTATAQRLDAAARDSRGLIDQLFYRALMLLGVAFVLMVLYRWISVRLARQNVHA